MVFWDVEGFIGCETGFCLTVPIRVPVGVCPI